jgi:hypothetical protein
MKSRSTDPRLISIVLVIAWILVFQAVSECQEFGALIGLILMASLIGGVFWWKTR